MVNFVLNLFKEKSMKIRIYFLLPILFLVITVHTQLLDSVILNE